MCVTDSLISQQDSGLVYGVCSQQGKLPYKEDEFAVSILPHILCEQIIFILPVSSSTYYSTMSLLDNIPLLFPVLVTVD